MGKIKKLTEEDNTYNGDLFINETRLKSIIRDMDKQLKILVKSLMSINVSVNKLINQKVIKENRLEAYKSLSNKAKSQAIAAEKFRKMLLQKYEDDLQDYPIQLLDKRIAALEEKIASLLEE